MSMGPCYCPRCGKGNSTGSPHPLVGCDDKSKETLNQAWTEVLNAPVQKMSREEFQAKLEEIDQEFIELNRRYREAFKQYFRYEK